MLETFGRVISEEIRTAGGATLAISVYLWLTLARTRSKRRQKQIPPGPPRGQGVGVFCGSHSGPSPTGGIARLPPLHTHLEEYLLYHRIERHSPLIIRDYQDELGAVFVFPESIGCPLEPEAVMSHHIRAFGIMQ